MAVQIRLLPDWSGMAGVEPNPIIVRRRAMGVPIVIAPPNDLLGLCITEDVETALSICAATGLGAWASGGASRLPALANAVPAYVDHVTNVADRDRYANALADRLRQRGIEVSCLGEVR
jgi:hypothetical protein